VAWHRTIIQWKLQCGSEFRLFFYSVIVVQRWVAKAEHVRTNHGTKIKYRQSNILFYLNLFYKFHVRCRYSDFPTHLFWVPCWAGRWAGRCRRNRGRVGVACAWRQGVHRSVAPAAGTGTADPNERRLRWSCEHPTTASFAGRAVWPYGWFGFTPAEYNHILLVHFACFARFCL